MLRESVTAVVARNECWTGESATEPYEAGWASEAVVFIRALKPSEGAAVEAEVQISPDGMHWACEGTRFALPRAAGEVRFARVAHFGNWLRVAARLPQGASSTVLVTLHLK